jgi:hypothetical protein
MVGLLVAAWALAALPHVASIWRALGRVDARGVFAQEVAAFFRIGLGWSLVAAVLLVLVARTGLRQVTRRWAALSLGLLALAAIGAVHIYGIAMYSLRIT